MNVCPAVLAALAAAVPADRVQKALDRVMAQSPYQTELPLTADGAGTTRVAPPERGRGIPIGIGLGGATPVIFWAGVAALVVVALVALWPSPGGPIRISPTPSIPEPARPPPRRAARASLAEVEARAREGKFAAAIHLLLLCALDELGAQASTARAPSLTAREMLDRARPAASARQALLTIVAEAERVHFGGREAGSSEYARCLAEFKQFLAVSRPGRRA